jgi:hypothetical protein
MNVNPPAIPTIISEKIFIGVSELVGKNPPKVIPKANSLSISSHKITNVKRARYLCSTLSLRKFTKNIKINPKIMKW